MEGRGMSRAVKVLCLAISVCLAANACFAETIILKSGKSIKGTIREKTAKYVKVDIGDGIIVTYFSDEIERIGSESFGGGAPQLEKKPAVVVMPAPTEEGFLGETEDGITLSLAQLYFKPPAGWRKQANVRHPTGVSFLYYSKNADYSVPLIGVTKDTPGEGVREAIDFSRQVRNEVVRTSPGLTVAEPEATTVAGYPASTFDMANEQKKLRTFWYQFLIDGTIISLQFMASSDSFENDVADFKAFAESMRVVRKKQ